MQHVRAIIRSAAKAFSHKEISARTAKKLKEILTFVFKKLNESIISPLNLMLVQINYS